MKRDGFTIVEVMIFLAISGLMLSMAMIGSGNLAKQTRFSDSVNSFHSSLQRQFEEVVSGVNTRQSTDNDCITGGQNLIPGTDECILLGKVITFNDVGGTQYTSRYVTDNGTSYSLIGTALAVIFNAQPRVHDTLLQSQDLAWGARFQVASRESAPLGGQPLKSAGSTRARINSIAFLRSPNGAGTITYYFFSPNPSSRASIELALRAATADPANQLTTNVRSHVCITNTEEWTSASAPVAAIVLGVGEGSVAIDTDYNPVRTGSASQCN